MGKLARNSVQRNTILDITDWVNDNICESLNVAIVAQRSGYTNWHFQRIFKNAHGVSLGSYIRMRRLMLSARDLHMTNDTILDIAIRYGFSSQQAFTRSFKSIFKITPNAYRVAIIESKLFIYD